MTPEAAPTPSYHERWWRMAQDFFRLFGAIFHFILFLMEQNQTSCYVTWHQISVLHKDTEDSVEPSHTSKPNSRDKARLLLRSSCGRARRCWWRPPGGRRPARCSSTAAWSSSPTLWWQSSSRCTAAALTGCFPGCGSHRRAGRTSSSPRGGQRQWQLQWR